jgi:hypothetical protein
MQCAFSVWTKYQVIGLEAHGVAIRERSDATWASHFITGKLGIMPCLSKAEMMTACVAPLSLLDPHTELPMVSIPAEPEGT